VISLCIEQSSLPFDKAYNLFMENCQTYDVMGQKVKGLPLERFTNLFFKV
jgi:hypothetical protein